jgi:uncharacterized protein (TIGR02246 family)
MKASFIMALAGLVVGFVSPVPGQDQSTINPETKQQIEAVSMKFVEAYNKYDAAALAALFTEDAVEVRNWPGDDHGGTASGREAIEKMFAADFAFNPGKMTTEIVQEYALGNDICAIANTSLGGTWKDQSATFYVRDVDTWKIRMAYISLPSSHRELKPPTPVQK